MYLLFLPLSHQLTEALCAPAPARRKVWGDSAPHPTQTMADTTLIPTQSWMLKTLHTRVFTKKTAHDCRYIGVKYHTAWSPTTQAPDMRLGAELWDPKACVRSCTFRRTLCIHEQKFLKKMLKARPRIQTIVFFKAHTRIYTHYVVCDWRLTLNSCVCVWITISKDKHRQQIQITKIHLDWWSLNFEGFLSLFVFYI